MEFGKSNIRKNQDENFIAHAFQRMNNDIEDANLYKNLGIFKQFWFKII